MAGKAGQAVLVVLAGMLFFSGLGWPQDFPERFPTLAGGTIGIEELAQGRWALLFVVIPGCPTCAEAIGWLGRVVTVFAQIRFALVAPELTPALVALVEANLPATAVVQDRGGVIGWNLGVRRAPTPILLVEGVVAGRLEWPFSVEDLQREPPDISGTSLSGEPVGLSDLPRPLLLVFFNPGCPPCWEVPSTPAEISQKVGVAVLACVGEADLSPTDRARLEEFLKQTREKPGTVVLVCDPDVLRAYGVARSPSFVLVDGKGVVSWVFGGLLGGRDLVAAVARATDNGPGRQ